MKGTLHHKLLYEHNNESECFNTSFTNDVSCMIVRIIDHRSNARVTRMGRCVHVIPIMLTELIVAHSCVSYSG